MPGSIANLSASLRWDLSEFDRGTAGIEGAFGRIRGLLNGLSDAVARFGTRMTAGITLPAGAIAAFSINAASDAKELQSAFDYTFGAISGRMNRWAEETGDAMGRATGEMQKGALAMGQLFLKAAPTEAAAGRLSQKFAVLAQDVASFYNVSGDEALNSIRAGLVGEAEPLRKFGVFLNAAAVEAKGLELGLIESGQSLNEYGKIMARSVLIADALSDATGDVERTSGSFANQIRALKADIQELAKSIGERLLPYAERFIGWLRDAIVWLRALPEPIKNIATAFGIFLIAIGPVILALSTLVVLILPLFIARFGLIGQIIIAILNPIGTAIVYLLRFATSWSFILSSIQMVGPALLRLMGPIGLVISAIILFRDDIVEAFRAIWREAEINLGGPFQKLMTAIVAISSEVRAALSSLVESDLGQAISNLVGFLGDLLSILIQIGGSAVISAIAAVLELLTGMAEYIVGVIRMVRQLFEGDWSGAWDTAAAVVGNAVTRIASWISGIFPQLSALLRMMGQVVGTSSFLSNNSPLGSAVSGAMGLFGEAYAMATGKGAAKEDLTSGDYAASGVPKVKGTGRGRGRSGPSKEDLADRREEIRLAQALAVARDKGDIEGERALQRQIDLRSRIDRYLSAGLAKQAAIVAAEKDMVELDQARAEAAARAIDDHERDFDLQLAEMRGDYEHIKALKDEEFLEKRILFFREQEVDLVNATRRAHEDLLAIEEARAGQMAARLADQEREREIELARIRGDHPDQIRALEENLRRDDRAAELRDYGKSPEEALAQANREAMDRSRAHLQGTFRDTFRDGLQAALNGNLGDFFENWMKDRTFNALSVVLDRLADSLANLVAGGRGGGGGLLGAIVQGFVGSIGGGTGFLGGSTNSAMGAQSVASLQSTFVPRFNTGGSFRVRGHAGIDQNLLSLNGNPVARVSSGEIMDIRQGGQGAGAVTINQKLVFSGAVDLATRTEVYRVADAARQAAMAGMAEAQMRSG